eukprot:scaffold99640_cov78-Phaeocystis_antarctica.AAC.5
MHTGRWVLHSVVRSPAIRRGRVLPSASATALTVANAESRNISEYAPRPKSAGTLPGTVAWVSRALRDSHAAYSSAISIYLTCGSSTPCTGGSPCMAVVLALTDRPVAIATYRQALSQCSKLDLVRVRGLGWGLCEGIRVGLGRLVLAASWTSQKSGDA